MPVSSENHNRMLKVISIPFFISAVLVRTLSETVEIKLGEYALHTDYYKQLDEELEEVRRKHNEKLIDYFGYRGNDK